MSTITATNLHGDTIRKTGGSLGVDIRVKNTSVYESDGGTSVTQNLVQGLCKSWVDFSMNPTNTILDSLNTSSFSDEGTGVAEITITNPFSSANWACAGGSWGNDASNGNIIPNAGNAGNTNKYWFYSFWHSGDVYDTKNNHGVAFGDLA